jgi:hypothetical protein
MYCPVDINTGFIQLVGPISQIDLNSISINSYPLSISFAPRTTIPTLIGNRIDEPTENVCFYKGKRFNLTDVQICSVTNKGFIIPGQSNEPVAELIVSFSSNTSLSDLSALSGILMCFPIYDSGNENHNDYILQLLDQSAPSCKYTNTLSSEYEGTDYQQIPNSSLTSCIRACCGDPNCLAYTYKTGSCHLKNTIQPLNKLNDNSIISGTVDHNTLNKTGSTSCKVPKINKNGQKDDTQSNVSTLESLMYSWDGDKSQTSFAYKTCFETIDNNNTPTSKSLYVVVFPNGIHLSQASYQQLLTQLNGTLQPYMIPPVIRGGDATLRSYMFDDEGNKNPTIVSQDGIIYATPLSSCTDDFRHRFEYFTLPPRLPKTTSFNTEQCPYYKTTQYKCVPFNQLKDLSGNYVIPGNKTLDTILYEQQQQQKEKINTTVGDTTKKSLSTEEIEGIVAGVAGIAIASILALKIGSWISNNA